MANLTKKEWEILWLIRKIAGHEAAKAYKNKVLANRTENPVNPWKYAFSDEYGSVTEKQFFPYDLTAEEMQAIADKTWIDRPNSPYDCTGLIFTVDVAFYRVPGGFWCYHSMVRDI